MRVYLSVDMEGVAGVVHQDQTDPTSPRTAAEYSRFRRLMTLEANAAIEGACAGGATAVLVNDSHWDMRNLLAEELDPRAELLSGSPKMWSMMEGIDRGWDLAGFIGYHAKAGTANAVLDHTYSGRIQDLRLNGTSVGELGLNAALAGSVGVPVAVVTGDRAVAQEALTLLGVGIRTVVVKDAVSRHAATSLAPEPARGRIRDAVRDAVQEAARGGFRPFTVTTPVLLEVDLVRTDQADHAAMVPGVERSGPRTVRFTGPDVREAFRAFRTIFNLAGLD